MSDPENLPASIGRYEVKRMLGGGAMGNVWLAEDPRIKRKVAVKTMRLDNLRNDADRHECLARFQREAEISGLLNHPGIVTIYDVGESELGPFLAMEFVPGKPLDGLIKARRDISFQEKLKIIAGVAEALDHAHSHGVIHRDVKPGNVMITEDGRPKLMDFGIAKREDASLTQTGTFLGTPSYASPEQIREGTVDNRSDVFSFGVMTFEVLSGQSPFPGNSINTILYRIVNEPPVEIVPPVLGVVPEGWRKVFSKVLSKQPQDRYATCISFVRDLMEVTTEIGKDERRELLGILHLPGAEPVAPPRLSKVHEDVSPVLPAEPRKSRAPLMIAAAALLTLGGGGAWLFLNGRGGETFQVSTVPDKAKIYVDGKLQETLSPTMVTLRAGAKIKVERKGFQAQELTFTPGQPLPKVMNLEPVISEVLIDSIPQGASVNIDGQSHGITPLKVAWNQGNRVKLTLSKGEQVIARDFEPGETPEGQIFKLGAEGEKQQIIDAKSDGNLRVAGAFAVRVKVDGKDLGELNASGQLPLPPGKHKLELSAPKVFFKEGRTITIQAGQATTVNLPGLAQIQIETFPGSAMILIDGQATGVESTGDTPLTVTKGTHVIGFDKKAAKQTVEITADGKLPRIKL
jgi:tRNA A-37 threonylcarbamoyl transferase component Bud32